MTVSSEVCIVLGALLGIAAACITPGLIFNMSEGMSEENETEKKDDENEQIITVNPNEVNENVSGTGQNDSIVEANEPNNNALNTEQSTTDKNKPTIVVSDQNNNVIPPKSLKPVVIRIEVNKENTDNEETSRYDDALSQITNHSNADVDIILHRSPKENNNDEETEYMKLPKDIAESCSQKHELKEKHGSFRKRMLILDNSNIQDNNVRLKRTSTFLNSKYKKIKKVFPMHEETIEYLDKLANCDCGFCKASTENDVLSSYDSKACINNVSNHQVTTKIPGIKYPIDVTAKSDEFEVIELLASDDASNENTGISNDMRVPLIQSRTPMQKLIRKIRNVFIFKKSLHQKAPVKAACNDCKAYTF